MRVRVKNIKFPRVPTRDQLVRNRISVLSPWGSWKLFIIVKLKSNCICLKNFEWGFGSYTFSSPCWFWFPPVFSLPFRSEVVQVPSGIFTSFLSIHILPMYELLRRKVKVGEENWVKTLQVYFFPLSLLTSSYDRSSGLNPEIEIPIIARSRDWDPNPEAPFIWICWEKQLNFK
jgi:hypothetical protein